MRIEGTLKRAKSWWAVSIPFLRINTQAKTKTAAYEMTADAIELAIDQPGFVIVVYPGKGDCFGIEASDPALLVAFALKQQRAAHGKTIREVAARMGSASPAAYSQYESGKRKPSLDQMVRLLRAIDDNLVPVISLAL